MGANCGRAVIACFGLVRSLPLALLFLALAGAADNVSAVFRSTILQSVTRTSSAEGCRAVAAAGGAEGDVEAGAQLPRWPAGEAFSVISGGVACMVLAVAWPPGTRGFLRYDARHPVP